MKHGKFYIIMTKRRDKYYQDVVEFCRTHREDVLVIHTTKNKKRMQLNHKVWLLYHVGLIETWDIMTK